VFPWKIKRVIDINRCACVSLHTLNRGIRYGKQNTGYSLQCIREQNKGQAEHNTDEEQWTKGASCKHRNAVSNGGSAQRAAHQLWSRRTSRTQAQVPARHEEGALLGFLVNTDDNVSGREVHTSEWKQNRNKKSREILESNMHDLRISA